MSQLEATFRQIEKERKRIEMIRNTAGIDPDFAIEETNRAKSKLKELKIELDKEYEYQNS